MHNIETQVFSEQLKQVYKLLPTSVFGVLGATILVTLLWETHSHYSLSIWFALVILNNGIIARLISTAYKKHGQGSLAEPKWKTRLLLFSLTNGIIWGMIGNIFYTGPTEYKLLIFVWLWSLAAGVGSLLASYKPVFYTMLLPLLMPLIITSAMDEDSFYMGLSAATLTWMLCIIFFQHSNHSTLVEAINLRFLNAHLVDELKIKNNEIQNISRDKSHFLAEASHDLRQPLHAQSLFISELDEYVHDPVGRRVLGGLEGSVLVMRRLLNSILDISKLEAGVIEPTIEKVAINDLFNEMEKEFKSQAREKCLDIDFKPCGLTVSTDHILLGSVLRNLITNAIRYTEQGRILVGCRRQHSKIIIQVFDTGIGIPKDKQEEIFSPFMQLGNPGKDQEKGLGLGLTIVQRIINLLDYKVSVNSTLGKGTAFSIDVPRISAAETNTATPTLTKTHTADISGQTVLVVDDDEAIRNGMQGLLIQWGCKPVLCSGFIEVKKYIETTNQRIDIMLVDFRLNDEATGIEVIDFVRQAHGNDIPAAVITGDTSLKQDTKAIDRELSIIHKPVMAHELRLLVEQLC